MKIRLNKFSFKNKPYASFNKSYFRTLTQVFFTGCRAQKQEAASHFEGIKLLFLDLKNFFEVEKQV